MKKNYIYLSLIILLGCGLRYLGIAKTGGLWFDELLTWNISKEAFPMGILHKIITEDFHFPLYYFILHFWMRIFGDGDLIIRFLSYTFGVLSIPAAYFAGKELKDERTGLFAALLISVNSFSIYYSQEVRFYSFLILLGYLSILFLLKFIKEPNKNNSILYAVTNLCILYTNTVAFLFVLAQVLIFALFLFLKNKNIFKQFIKIQLYSLIAFIPGLFMIIHANDALSHAFIKPFSWWGPFDPFTIISSIQNWFSPIFLDSYNASEGYYNYIFSNPFILTFSIIGIFIPILLYFTSFYKVLKGDKFQTEKSYVFLIGVLLFIFLISLCLLDKFRLITRYTTLCLPSMLLITACYLSSINSKKVLNLFLSFLVFLNIFCFVIPTISTPFMQRSGIKYVTENLKKYNVNESDVIFMGENGEFLPKYLPIKKESIIPFMEFHAFVRGDKKHLGIIMDEKLIDSLTMSNSREKLKPYLLSKYPSQTLTKYINNKISTLKPNRYFIVVAPRWTINDYPRFKQAVQHPESYNYMSLCYFLMMKTYNDVASLVKYNVHMQQVERIDINYWTILIYQKNS